MSTRTTESRRAGFTLIEALASLMLVGLILPLVIRGVSVSARGAAYADREATAVMLAQSRMDEVLLEGDWWFGDAGGTFAEAYGREAERYQWQLTVADWQSTGFSELMMRVSWGEGSANESVQVTTVINAGL